MKYVYGLFTRVGYVKTVLKSPGLGFYIFSLALG